MRRIAAPVLLALALLATACGTDESSGDAPGLDPEPGSALTDDWAQLAPLVHAPITERAASSCHRGDPGCLDAVLVEMEARLAARPCAHTAPFAFTYLRMTRGVDDALEQFGDAATISVIDARFARQYFDAFDNWYAGRTDDVPAAWQIAFATADRQESTAALDLLLGMNAHISRDLAYIVADLLRDAERFEPGDEPEDYRFVNDVIGSVKSPMLLAAADRFDPSLFLLDTELPGDDVPDPVELIGEWRSFAFELGERLAFAATPEEEAATIAEIERTSAAAAAVLVAAEAAEGLTEVAGGLGTGGEVRFLDAEQRRAYCERDR